MEGETLTRPSIGDQIDKFGRITCSPGLETWIRRQESEGINYLNQRCLHRISDFEPAAQHRSPQRETCTSKTNLKIRNKQCLEDKSRKVVRQQDSRPTHPKIPSSGFLPSNPHKAAQNRVRTPKSTLEVSHSPCYQGKKLKTPKKRGRPLKNASEMVHKIAKRRGRPPKNASGIALKPDNAPRNRAPKAKRKNMVTSKCSRVTELIKSKQYSLRGNKEPGYESHRSSGINMPTLCISRSN